VKLGAAMLLLCALIAPARGASASGQGSESGGGTPPAAAHPPPDPRLFSILGVTMGRAGLDPVMAKLGEATVVMRRDAPRSICYVGSDQTFVVFEETTTGWGYTMYSMKTPPLDLLNANDCKPLFRLNAATSNGVGLHVGQPLGEVKEVLGPPHAAERQRSSWVYAAQESIAPGSDPRLPPEATRVEVRTKISIRFKHGGATRIAVFAVESPVAPAGDAPR